MRLAPENPFPAAVHDAWEGVLWVLGQGKETLGLDTTKLATGTSGPWLPRSPLALEGLCA